MDLPKVLSKIPLKPDDVPYHLILSGSWYFFRILLFPIFRCTTLFPFSSKDKRALQELNSSTKVDPKKLLAACEHFLDAQHKVFADVKISQDHLDQWQPPAPAPVVDGKNPVPDVQDTAVISVFCHEDAKANARKKKKKLDITEVKMSLGGLSENVDQATLDSNPWRTSSMPIVDDLGTFVL